MLLKKAGFLIGCLGCLSVAHADSACEKRIADTGMTVLKTDPKSICDENPSKATQDCMVELLGQGKGKLRNQDFVQVYALCKVDPSKEMRECFTAGLASSSSDPKYVPAQKLMDRCLLSRKKYKVKIQAKAKK